MKWKNETFWCHLIDDALSKIQRKPITGKYLFFSEDQQKLVDLAESEVANHGFFRAKISTTGNPDFVLCLYWMDDSRKNELAQRHSGTGVKYRYWKSDAATRRGEYSQQHKESRQS